MTSDDACKIHGAPNGISAEGRGREMVSGSVRISTGDWHGLCPPPPPQTRNHDSDHPTCRGVVAGGAGGPAYGNVAREHESGRDG